MAAPTERFIVLDTETTGLRVGLDRVVEIGLLEIDGEGLPTSWKMHHMINPECAVGTSEAIHHLSDALLRAQPTFAQLAPALWSALKGRTIVAHNAGFDIGMLDAEFRRAGMPALAAHLGKVIDTVTLARRVIPDLRRANLDALMERFELKAASARVAAGRHGAFEDACDLARVFAHLRTLQPPPGQDIDADLPRPPIDRLSPSQVVGIPRFRRALG